MWGPEQVTHDLTYDFYDGSIRTVSGRILGTAPSLTAAARSFPDRTVFEPLNVGERNITVSLDFSRGI